MASNLDKRKQEIHEGERPLFTDDEDDDFFMNDKKLLTKTQVSDMESTLSASSEIVDPVKSKDTESASMLESASQADINSRRSASSSAESCSKQSRSNTETDTKEYFSMKPDRDYNENRTEQLEQEVGQNLQEVGQISEKVGQMCEDVGQKVQNVGQSSQTLDEVSDSKYADSADTKPKQMSHSKETNLQSRSPSKEQVRSTVSTHPLLVNEDDDFEESACFSYTYSKDVTKATPALVPTVRTKDTAVLSLSSSTAGRSSGPGSLQGSSSPKGEDHKSTRKVMELLDPDELFKGKVPDEITEIGAYSYLTLVAVAFHKLYDYAKCDRKYIEASIKTLGEHLKQLKPVIEAAQVVARGDGMDETDPFTNTLKSEKIIKKYGVEVILFDLVALILKQGAYDARSRSLLRFLSLVLRTEWERVEQFEEHVIDTFMEEEHTITEEEKNEKMEKDKKQKLKRYALIGVATVGGGALLGLTGGLAAPLIAAGAGAVIGGAGAAALGSVAGIYIIGSLFGVAGAGLAGYKMKKRVGDLEEFEFEPLTEGRQLHVTIAISGWLTEESHDFKTAWRGLDNSKEQYVLRYESRYLTEVGSAMDYIVDMAVKTATTEALKYTVLSGLMAAVAWPATLLAASNIIDNPWSVVMNRSALAGKQLADVLLSRHQGKRPVTLLGFSLGARVIYYCLQELAKRKNSEGIIEDVVLLGTPVTGNPSDWSNLSRVVSGRIINGYCSGDWLLKFLYRTASVQMTIAGLAPIDWQNRRMHNIDLSDVVNGHMDYMKKIDDILEIVGVRTKPHPTEKSPDSLQQWCKTNKTSTLKKSTSGGAQSMVTSGKVSKGSHGDKIVTGQPLDIGNLEKGSDALCFEGKEGLEEEGFLAVDSQPLTPDSGVMSLVSTVTEDPASQACSEEDVLEERRG